METNEDVSANADVLMQQDLHANTNASSQGRAQGQGPGIEKASLWYRQGQGHRTDKEISQSGDHLNDDTVASSPCLCQDPALGPGTDKGRALSRKGDTGTACAVLIP